MNLLIDNYDSFSFNLYQVIGETDPDIKVIRNDELTVDEIKALNPGRIIISPGPGRPGDAGVIVNVIKELGSVIPMLGVCLGHQAICQAYGAEIVYAKKMMHGKQSSVRFEKDFPVTNGCPGETKVARYHSLAVSPQTVPDCLKVMGVADDGEIMAVAHREYPVFGLQFHPESIMTPEGSKMINNFIHLRV